MSFRSWVTIITLVLLAFVVYFGREEIVKAFNLLGSVDIFILSLLVPIQLISYYAVGGTIFSYLRAKGDLENVSQWSITRMALELNFVNHIIPSGGVAGFSYLSWLLGRHKVSVSRSVMAQVVRFVTFIIIFIAILIISVIMLVFENKVNGTIMAISLALVILTLILSFLLFYIIEDREHLITFSKWISRTANKIIKIVTFGRVRGIVKRKKIEDFFIELHEDYLAIKRDKKILLKPFLWSFVANIMDVGLIFVAFLALGSYVSPAILFITFGLSGLSGIVSITPGGTGIYEAVMIAFLASCGIEMDIAIAGTILSRVALLLGTIVFGYFFYQLTVMKYGKKMPSEYVDK